MKQQKEAYSSKEINSSLNPLITEIKKIAATKKPGIIGLQGGPGTGKTTLAKFLREQLTKAGYKVLLFSLDDFYESYTVRKSLAQRYPHNPFYQISRGLPGTHRIRYLQEVLQKLKRGKSCRLPIFDKSLHHAAGDISIKTITVKRRVDIVLFEGWCVGIPMVSSSELRVVCDKNNIPLRQIDPSLHHHKVVLQYLQQYLPLWKYLDYLIQLKPDNFALHLQWRWQQEKELRKKTGKGMTKKQVEKFVLPYLPFTYVCYEKLKADATLMVNKRHKMYDLTFRNQFKP